MSEKIAFQEHKCEHMRIKAIEAVNNIHISVQDTVSRKLTRKKDTKPQWSKVKCPPINPDIVASDTVSLISVSPAIQTITGNRSKPAPKIGRVD
jgi:hypothetical protein